jgi:hypothetical protein
MLMTFLVGCSAEKTEQPSSQRMQGELALELRDTAQVAIEVAPGAANRARALTVKITPSKGHGVLAPGVEVSSAGTQEPFAEVGGLLYTAKLSVPAVAGGPCGDKPISLALSLHRHQASAIVAGGLSAYCGAGKWHGVPVRVLRLAGTLAP